MNVSTQNVATIALESLSLFIIMPGAILANGVAIFIILRTRSLRKHTHNLLILSLNIADLGVALFTMPCAMISVFDGGKYLMTTADVCKINGFMAVLFTFALPLCILFITLERFLVVNLSHRFPRSRRRVCMFIAMTWATSLMAAILPFTPAATPYRYVATTRHCTPNWLDAIYYAAGLLLLAGEIPLLLLLYAAIVYNLKKAGTSLRKTQRSYGDLPKTSSYIKDQSALSGDDIASSRPGDNDPGADESEAVEGVTSADFSGHVVSISTGVVTRSKSKLKGRRKRSFGARRRQWSAQRRVATIGAMLVITTVICWVPYLLVHLEIAPVPDGHWFGVMTMWFAFTNVLLDPVIYTFMNRQARAELTRFFQNLTLCCQQKLCRRWQH